MFGCENDLLFNPIKSVCLVFKPRHYTLYCDKRHSASDMFVSNGVHNFESLIRNNVFDFRNRVNNSANQLIATLRRRNNIVTNGSMHTNWARCLLKKLSG